MVVDLNLPQAKFTSNMYAMMTTQLAIHLHEVCYLFGQNRNRNTTNEKQYSYVCRCPMWVWLTETTSISVYVQYTQRLDG